VGGLDTRQPENRGKLQSMVGMVFQNPADQILASTVEEDVAFGLENINLPTAEIRVRVAEQLSAAGLMAEASRPPHLLSGGQIQMVALAGVLARQPRVILFDEPTSMLDPQARQSFLARVLQLRQVGMTIVYITHHMEETLDADQVVVLQDGKIAFTGTPAEIFYGEHNLYEAGLDKPGVARLVESFQSLGWRFSTPILSTQSLLDALPNYSGNFTDKHNFNQKNNGQPGNAQIYLENVHYTYLSGSPLARKALKSVDLNIFPGNIHAIAGANGSGKSTLLQHINGILRPELGRVQVEELILDDPHTRLQDVVRKVGLVFQNPEAQFFEVFVGDEIAYGPGQFGFQDIRDRVRHTMAMVGLDFNAFKDRRLETLSGGEKRKVALASTLVLDQNILMFDEPTAGMDPRARDELMRLFSQLQTKGKTILIASHRMEELAAVSNTLSLMQSGQVILTGECGQVMTNTFALEKANLLAPLAVKVAQTLIEKQWPIKAELAYSSAGLISSIKDCIT
jgi:energy-coupling factor transport system ATP-binding protein